MADSVRREKQCQQDALMCTRDREGCHVMCKECLDTYRNEVLEEAATLLDERAKLHDKMENFLISFYANKIRQLKVENV